MPHDLVDDITSVRFASTTFGAGYDMEEVDDFLDHLAAAVGEGQDVGQLIADARFAATSFREGYDQSQVDDFLDAVVARASGHPSASAPASPASPTSDLPSPTLPRSTGGLFGWLHRRG